MQSSQQAAKLLMILVALAVVSAAETKQEIRFTVGPRATITIVNQYGGISVKPSTSNLVVVVATKASDKIEIERTPENNDAAAVTNRINITTQLFEGVTPSSGKVDYEVLVPADASVILESANGVLHVEKLRGDVEIEGAQPTVDVREISDAHVHVKTIDGPVTLTNIKGGHVEVDSISGNINLVDVAGPLVHVSSTRGKITYDGDFGLTGEYRLVNHSGDIDATIPENTSADIQAISRHGKVQDEFHLKPKAHSASSFIPTGAASFIGTTISTVGHSASSVLLRTFSGRIHLQKRQ